MVAMDLTPDDVRELVPELTSDEARALAEWYAGLARGVAAFPQDDLRRVEAPMRSTPGPA